MEGLRRNLAVEVVRSLARLLGYQEGKEGILLQTLEAEAGKVRRWVVEAVVEAARVYLIYLQDQ